MKKLITKNILIVLLIAFIISLSTVLFIEKNNKKLSSEVVDRKIKNRSLITSSDNEDNTIKDDNEPNKDIPTNKEIKEEQNISKNNNSNNKEEIALETKTEVPRTNNNVSQTTTNDDSSNSNINSNNDSNNNTDNNNSNNELPPSALEEPPVVEDNSVRTNDIFYRIHKGRIDYTDLDTCQSETLDFYLNYIRNINNLNYIEVMSNSDKILGYFVQYVFKEARYDNYEECNNIGNSIRSSLSDRVTSYQCTERDNNYYLKIFTDYD